PYWWPHVTSGDDLAGSQRLAFFVKDEDGKYQDVARTLGLAIPVPTRGIAVGDADGDGRLDMAVARQWDEPVFYKNTGTSNGKYLSLKLLRDTEPTPGSLPASGSPVVDAQVKVTTRDGRTHISRVDGGSGHSGKRSNEVHVGLGP